MVSTLRVRPLFALILERIEAGDTLLTTPEALILRMLSAGLPLVIPVAVRVLVLVLPVVAKLPEEVAPIVVSLPRVFTLPPTVALFATARLPAVTESATFRLPVPVRFRLLPAVT